MDDSDYATINSTNGILGIRLSKNSGTSYTVPLYKTYTGVEGYLEFGAGETELWGYSWTGDDVNDTNFRLQIMGGPTGATVDYKDFGLIVGGSEIVTGLKVLVKGKWDGTILYINIITITVYYGTSVLPVQAGSQAYATDGRKNGEGAGAGTGVLVFYDGSNWMAVDSGQVVDD